MTTIEAMLRVTVQEGERVAERVGRAEAVEGREAELVRELEGLSELLAVEVLQAEGVDVREVEALGLPECVGDMLPE